MAAATVRQVTCERCGEPFEARNATARFCCNSCKGNRRARNGDRLLIPNARGKPLDDEALRSLRECALDELLCAAEAGATSVHLANVARLVRRVDERLAS